MKVSTDFLVLLAANTLYDTAVGRFHLAANERPILVKVSLALPTREQHRLLVS
jgi:hypothetical protein